MPGMDGTGPLGNGPLTGGRRGRCVGNADAPPAMGRGRGAGYGRGGGRGFRHQYYATGLTGWQRAQMDTAVAQPVAEPQTDRVQHLEARLDEVLARLSRLEGAG